jgi:hypothetical protein
MDDFRQHIKYIFKIGSIASVIAVSIFGHGSYWQFQNVKIENDRHDIEVRKFNLDKERYILDKEKHFIDMARFDHEKIKLSIEESKHKIDVNRYYLDKEKIRLDEDRRLIEKTKDAALLNEKRTKMIVEIFELTNNHQNMLENYIQNGSNQTDKNYKDIDLIRNNIETKKSELIKLEMNLALLEHREPEKFEFKIAKPRRPMPPMNIRVQ